MYPLSRGRRRTPSQCAGGETAAKNERSPGVDYYYYYYYCMYVCMYVRIYVEHLYLSLSFSLSLSLCTCVSGAAHFAKSNPSRSSSGRSVPMISTRKIQIEGLASQKHCSCSLPIERGSSIPENRGSQSQKIEGLNPIISIRKDSNRGSRIPESLLMLPYYHYCCG